MNGKYLYPKLYIYIYIFSMVTLFQYLFKWIQGNCLVLKRTF